MGLSGLLMTADGTPAERARLAEVQIETLDVLLGGVGTPADSVLSPTLRLAAVRQAMDALHVWCPLLREAEKVAAENALCLAAAALDLSRLLGGDGDGPDLACNHSRSWDAFCSAPNVGPGTQARIVKALSIKRDLLRLTAELERELAHADLVDADRREQDADRREEAEAQPEWDGTLNVLQAVAAG